MSFQHFHLPSTWSELFAKPEVYQMLHKIDIHLNACPKPIYPPKEKIFQAFETTEFSSVRVVLIGQDPYHQPNQAMGLSFSVPKGIKVPPSLKNIFKSLDISSASGDLTCWAHRGVLLLNRILTVSDSRPLSHKSVGWLDFTNEVVKFINQNKEGIVFLLLGRDAQFLERFIDPNKHTILKSSHPSPLGYYRGFHEDRALQKAEEILGEKIFFL
ncbi:MAG: uracil-DNA glycosylase [Chitinophagales bacterium]|jgi:uracil-DNA glycosylase|nr:uracil-DNA glycosylase [Chitinophagales bacterium]